jgi:hypothetical protein
MTVKSRGYRVCLFRANASSPYNNSGKHYGLRNLITISILYIAAYEQQVLSVRPKHTRLLFYEALANINCHTALND